MLSGGSPLDRQASCLALSEVSQSVLYPQRQPLLGVKKINDGDVGSGEFDESFEIAGAQIVGDANGDRGGKDLICHFQQEVDDTGHELLLLFWSAIACGSSWRYYYEQLQRPDARQAVTPANGRREVEGKQKQDHARGGRLSRRNRPQTPPRRALDIRYTMQS